jgi:hypothetical protein
VKYTMGCLVLVKPTAPRVPRPQPLERATSFISGLRIQDMPLRAYEAAQAYADAGEVEMLRKIAEERGGLLRAASAALDRLRGIAAERLTELERAHEEMTALHTVAAARAAALEATAAAARETQDRLATLERAHAVLRERERAAAQELLRYRHENIFQFIRRKIVRSGPA